MNRIAFVREMFTHVKLLALVVASVGALTAATPAEAQHSDSTYTWKSSTGAGALKVTGDDVGISVTDYSCGGSASGNAHITRDTSGDYFVGTAGSLRFFGFFPGPNMAHVSYKFEGCSRVDLYAKADCKCTRYDVTPVVPPTVEASLEKGVFRITITTTWNQSMTCELGDGGCFGTKNLEAESSWTADGKPGDRKDAGAIVESHDSPAEMPAATIICSANPCKETTTNTVDTKYEARVKKKNGANITNSVQGRITLTLKEGACPGNSWNMILVYNATFKYDKKAKKRVVDEGGIDKNASDYDGDGLSNGAEKKAKTNPLNPDHDGDGIPDGKDRNPKNPNKP